MELGPGRGEFPVGQILTTVLVWECIGNPDPCRTLGSSVGGGEEDRGGEGGDAEAETFIWSLVGRHAGEVAERLDRREEEKGQSTGFLFHLPPCSAGGHFLLLEPEVERLGGQSSSSPRSSLCLPPSVPQPAFGEGAGLLGFGILVEGEGEGM